MRGIKVNLKERSYNIIVGSNIIDLLGKSLIRLNLGSDAFIITNSLIKNRYANKLEGVLRKSGFKAKFRVVPDSEKSKSITTATSVIKDLVQFDVKRRIFIVAFGGGVVGDLAGFIASIYKRGVSYIQVPTTLLAQVDSSIGGKTAVDLPQGKNLIGAFYQPRLVFSDVKFLSTLSPRQIRSGFAEVIKYGIIKDKELFSYLENNYSDLLSLKPAALEYGVTRSSQIKAQITSRDEREEKGLRTILNFGHTIGHAIEAASGYDSYNHGEAIALGMLAASNISKSFNLINKNTYNRIESLIKEVGLPTAIRKIPLERIINAHYRDKKFIGSKNRFVLPVGIGRTKIVENIPLKTIEEAIRKILFP